MGKKEAFLLGFGVVVGLCADKIFAQSRKNCTKNSGKNRHFYTSVSDEEVIEHRLFPENFDSFAVMKGKPEQK